MSIENDPVIRSMRIVQVCCVLAIPAYIFYSLANPPPQTPEQQARAAYLTAREDAAWAAVRGGFQSGDHRGAGARRDAAWADIEARYQAGGYMPQGGGAGGFAPAGRQPAPMPNYAPAAYQNQPGAPQGYEPAPAWTPGPSYVAPGQGGWR